MMPKSTFLLILMLACLRGSGQELLFNHLTSEDGLDPGAVLCIAQDNNGFMWFGTQNGLDRFDTRRFKHYKSSLSKYIDVPENYITHLLVDTRHQLWVGTRNGLNIYNPVTDLLDPITLTDQPGKNNVSISCIYEDRQRNIWIWSSAGLFKRGQKGTFQQVPVPDSVAGLAENNNLRSIYQDKTGAYWIGSSLGLTRMVFEKEKALFSTFRHNSQDKESLSDNYVTVITGDEDDRLWIGTQQGGLNYYDPLKQAFRRYESGAPNGLINNNIRDITIDSLGQLWIGTQGGISIFNPREERFINYHSNPEQIQSLSHNSVYSIFLDHHGTAWIGTYWGGVNAVAVNNTPFHIYRTGSYPQGINNNVVSAISEDAVHNLWVGTEGGGLNYLNSATQQVTVFRHNVADSNSLGSDLVKMIYKDTDGNFWVGTHGGGLNVFNPSAGKFTRYFYKDNDPVVRSSEVLSMLESSDGICWIGMQTGLLAYKRTGRILSRLPENHLTKIVGSNSIKAMLQARNGDIWVGTSGALFLLPHDGQNVLRFTTKDDLPRNNINCIQEDATGNIWVGCAFGGLARYTPAAGDKKFEVYTKENGLPDDNIAAIRADGRNNLWISTGNGLCKLDVGRMVFKNYNKSDGLAGNIFNINSSCITSDGRLMFGGYNGITFFHPEEIKENLFAPRTFLTRLKLFDQTIAVHAPDRLLDKEISQMDHISFTSQQNVFTLEFATLNYVQSDKNVYAYTLEGFDKEWNYATSPAATYMNLPAGEYDFLAKGTNNDGIWGPSVRLHITVLPPIWKTWLAYIIYTLLLIAVGFFVIRFFVLRSLIRKDKELTRLKLDFFTNISHEMRSRLSLIIGPAEKLLLINKEDYENTRQLQIIRKNSESLLHLITELMDFRKAESGNLVLHVAEQDIVAFVRDIFFTFEDRALSMNIQYDFVCPSPVVIPFDREQLEKVFYNLFYNAYKFTPSGGSITAIIEDQKEEVVIAIQDTGRGVSTENLPKLFTNYFQEDDQDSDNKGYGIGLALAKSIIELHGGTITVNSTRTERGNTTVFTVTLRKGYRHFDQVVKQPLVESVDKKGFSLVGVPALIPAAETSVEVRSAGEKKYTVLLIEDNAEILQFNREVLEKNYNVITSSNGNEGWDAAVEAIPDIIVSDVMMPGMDGYTLCNKLKTDDRTDHIPVVLLTAMSTSAQQLSGLQKGADVYLTKPYSIHMLVLHIGNLLSLREKIHARLAKQLVSDTGVVVPAFEEAPDVIQDPFLLKVIEIIEENMEEPGFGVDVISRKLAMSRPVLYKKLNMLTGVTVNDFIKAIRMKKAVSYLGEGIYNISEVAYKVGYSDPKYFSKEFKKHFGKSPREWKKGE